MSDVVKKCICLLVGIYVAYVCRGLVNPESGYINESCDDVCSLNAEWGRVLLMRK